MTGVQTCALPILALSEYEILWAAAGHPHAVFPLTFSELKEITQGEIRFVGEG